MDIRMVRGACPHDCPDTCGMVMEVSGNKVLSIQGDPDHPITRGWLCAKVRPYLDHVYHPDRLLHPLRRTGSKGSGQFRPISWDEAIKEIADRWKEIIEKHGPEAILPYSYSGTLGLVQMVVSSGRFWNRLGASQLQRSICGAAAETAVEKTLGKRWSPPYHDVVHSKLVILWGHNPASTGPHFMPWLREAQRKGCILVVVDPRKTLSAQGAHLHLAPHPGSDGVLAMGLAKILVDNNHHDLAWVEKHVQGWPLIRRKLSDFPLERVESETGIDQSAILELARLYGTIRPGLIKIADGINRNFHGGQNVRALCLLPALTGQFGTPGGGFSYSTSGYISWEKESVHKWSECPEPGRSINMNRLGESLLGEARDPEIKSLFVFGANPATSSPNAGKITKGLRREDLFTIVHEIFLTDTALHADFVLPATTQLEQTDLHKAYGHTCLTYNAQAIPPRGESKSNWEVMGLLAKAMGFQEAWLHQSPDEVIDEVLKATAAINPFLKGIDLDQLREKGHASLNLGDSLPFSGGIFPTPSGKIDFETPIPGSDGTPQIFGDFPPRKDRGEMPLSESDKGYHFVTAASHHFVTSTFANHPQMKKNARADFIEINPSDAAGKDIEEGDMVEVYNGRGSCRLRARLTDNVRTGTVASPKGNWSSLLKGNNVNWLTTDELGDMGGQSCFHSTRVWLKRLSKGRDQK